VRVEHWSIATWCAPIIMSPSQAFTHVGAIVGVVGMINDGQVRPVAYIVQTFRTRHVPNGITPGQQVIVLVEVDRGCAGWMRSQTQSGVSGWTLEHEVCREQ
jgi:hypothetical protein